jgi:hypothetical protein
MKVFKLSAVTALLVTSVTAGGLSLYEDPVTHQVFTEAGEGRVKLGNYIDEMSAKDSLNNAIKEEVKTKLKAKAEKLQFHGRHYLGYTYSDYEGDKQDSGKFETRRNYLQVKAYFDKKSYARVTLDTHNINDGKDVTGGDLDGTWNVRLKYAYAYLADILPYTGVEIGQVHRPWIDYEEHHGWWYRHISKVFIEADEGAHLINSADLGVNFKTNLENFSSELAILNGEGYHANDGTLEAFDTSFEWRLTAHFLGTGNKKLDRKKDEYADASFFGVMSQAHNKSSSSVPTDFNMYGVHAVYNNPMFLVSGQYVKADDDETKYDGDGYSVNFEARPLKDWTVLGKYDKWEAGKAGLHESEEFIYGVGYQYNKYVEFVVNARDVKDDRTDYLLTAYVNW